MKWLSTVLLWVFVAVVLGFGVQAASYPSSPTLFQNGSTSTYNAANRALQSIDAYAGNITWLYIEGLSQTKAWQGYYGNITGTITLDDVNNFTFYNWTSANPRGQIYATLNTTISWEDVFCFNFTADTLNDTVIGSYYNIQPIDPDHVNNTFNQTDHPTFEVGSRTMDNCPTTYINQDDAYQQLNFVNVLLWDITNNQTGWIYTTLIEDKTANSAANFHCYNGETCDFQILVNEDGHGTDTGPTTYYFWVELL